MSKRFGPYQVQEVVGKGALGAVYRAVRDSDGRSVALKILHSDICNQPEIRKRFEVEIPAMARLGYAHIHRINQHGILNQRVYLESDYRAAGSLGARLRTSTQQNTQQSIRLLRHMADALNFAHRQGIHHHGLTLENILLNDRADAVVSDFGLRRIVGLRQVLVAGDVPYTVAPEQIRGSSIPDHRADLYAMGIIAYALLVGRWPFYGDQAALLKAHLQEDVPPPSRVNVHLPPALDTVLLKALAKRPDERYASADILVEALARVLPEPLLITIRLWEADSTPADLSIRSRSTGELRSLAKTAADFYHLAQAARRESDAIAYLKRALELDPYHTDANRLLFKLEGARPQVTPDKAFQTPPQPAALAPTDSPVIAPEPIQLKKPRTKRRRSGWTYVGIFGFVMFGLTGVLLVTYITGGSLAPLEILLTGKRPVTEIEGTPIRDIPGAVLTLEPQQSHDLSTDGTSGDTLSAGYVHEYVFTVNSGREVYIYVQFLSTAATNVGPHVAVLRPDGSDITPECQASEILQDGSGIAYVCPASQSGQWQVRVIGIDGESTGAYVVSVTQG